MPRRKTYADIPAPSDLFERVVAEIEARLRQLRPAVEEQLELLKAAKALGLGVNEPAVREPAARRAPDEPRGAPSPPPRRGRGRPPGPTSPPPRRGRGRPPGSTSARGATQQAIVDALEHGSHTLSELVVVTALSAAAIRKHVGGLLEKGIVKRAKREGRSAYELVRPPA